MYSFDTSVMPHCTRFGRMKQKNGWEQLDFRRNEQNLLVFLIHGQAEFVVEGKQHLLQEGDVLIVPTGASYRAYTEDFCEYYFYRFDGKMEKTDRPVFPMTYENFSFELPPLADSRIFLSDQTQTGQDFQRVYSSALACAEYHARGSAVGQRLLECEFLKILLTLADVAEREAGMQHHPTALSRMMVYIKKNLTKPITPPEICAYCGISASYGARLFRKHMNMTMTEYINSEKLSYAWELMCNTSLKLTEIADYLGYCDVYYFSRRFKRKFGKSPNQMLSAKQN